MNTILIVDDSELDRRLAAGLLSKNARFHIEQATDGKDALAKIEAHQPDLVVTDLVMPEMDGLELVKAIRLRYPQVPVILMTAYGNENIAANALDQGAASYVPKAQQAERLVETVERVLERVLVDRNQQRLMGSVTRLDCSFALESDPELVPPFVSLIQQALAGAGICDATGRMRVGVALEEALLNAIYHGNLELSGEDLTYARNHLEAGWLTAQVGQRRGETPYRNRKILVDVCISPASARFVVRDSGAGFDLAAASTGGLSARFERGRGRGLLLMRKLMDEVTFNANGNEVTLVKRAEKKPRA